MEMYIYITDFQKSISLGMEGQGVSMIWKKPGAWGYALFEYKVLRDMCMCVYKHVCTCVYTRATCICNIFRRKIFTDFTDRKDQYKWNFPRSGSCARVCTNSLPGLCSLGFTEDCAMNTCDFIGKRFVFTSRLCHCPFVTCVCDLGVFPVHDHLVCLLYFLI